MYPPTPAVAIARGSARDSEASAAACSPSLAGSSGADSATTSYPSKARSVPQCHAASVWKNVHFLAFWLAFEICFIGISERANGPRPSCPSRSFPSFTAMLLKRGEGAFSRAGSCSRHSEGDLMPSDRAVARSLPSFTAMLLRRGEGFCLRAGGAFVSLLAGL